MAAQEHYLVYADGACKGNPGPGGWGVIILAGVGKRLEFNGADRATTNNKMELTAAIEALRHLPIGAHVTLRSDSQYLVNTITKKWKRNLNRDLWEDLDSELEQRRVELEWVRGHAGDALNERADELANMAIRGEYIDAPPAVSGGVKAAEAPPKLALTAGEVIRECAACGREFVASAPSQTHCNLVRCQQKARE